MIFWWVDFVWVYIASVEFRLPEFQVYGKWIGILGDVGRDIREVYRCVDS